MRLASLLTLIVALAGVGHAGAAPVAAAETQTVAGLNAAFSPFDQDGDGVAEIRWVRNLGEALEAQGPRRGLVLVVVEPRLLAEADKFSGAGGLRACLRTFAEDLSAEGWVAATVVMQVYDGPVHQDGRTVLAMREYFRKLKARVADFAGVVIVGSFPEAMLVRQYNWRQQDRTVLHQGQPDQYSLGDKPVYRLRSVPENVAMRCDLIPADLDGNWEKLYHCSPEALPRIMACYPGAHPDQSKSLDLWPSGGPTGAYELGTETFTDFFLVNDGRFTTESLPDGRVNLKLQDDQQDDECSAADRLRTGNVMAHPDILMSRINTRHIALKPKASIHGIHGEGLLDAGGLPQTVTFASAPETPRGLSVWEQDSKTEQQLLCEYFVRNHRYRKGEFSGTQLKPATVAYGLGSPMGDLVDARPQWKGFSEPGFEVRDDQADLEAVVEWMKRPAILRDVCAHSDPWGSAFKQAKSAAALEKACGGQPWNWIKQGNKLVPTLGAAGKLDYAIYRTIWQNNAMPDQACFYLHHGCDITSPGGGWDRRYNDPDYAYWQGAEGLLYYCKGLALVGRSKGFYDFPTDFAKVLGEGKTFGEAWAHYFDVESRAKTWDDAGGGIGRKRAYWWNVLGDWTLMLK